MADRTLAMERRRQARADRSWALIRLCTADTPAAGGARHPLVDIREVAIGRADGESSATADGDVLTLSIADGRMSGRHARLLETRRGWELVDQNSTNGTLVNGVEIDRAELSDGDRIQVGHTFFLVRHEAEADIDEQPDGWALDPDDPGSPRTFSLELAQQYRRLARLAPSTLPVIITGESGTGKELAARALHRISERPGAFVPVNCGALPANLVESELFGHKKGSFSGAGESRDGLVRAADRGTLFLDEIGDLPASAQVALLRVLQEREVRPVGETTAVPVDLRVAVASHRDLGRLVDDGAFRADLYARLSGSQIELAPLRRRREDLGLLIAALLGRAGAVDAELDVDAAEAMLAYDWPLNVRELEQALSSAVLLAAGGPIGLEHLPPAVRAPASPPAAETPDDDDERRRWLVQLLREHRGNISGVARASGKARMQIQRWMKRYKLERDDFV